MLLHVIASLLLRSQVAPAFMSGARENKIPHEGALAQEMANSTAVRTVYDFPVAGHLCSDGAVRYIKLVRRPGNSQPQGLCAQCQTEFQYQKPQRSRVRHYGTEGASHF
jgi:hypothetical protein